MKATVRNICSWSLMDMIVFDGTYRWKTPLGPSSRSFRKSWEMSCNLKVIDMTLAQPEVTHLKRYVVLASETTPCPVKTSVAETMGRRIFRDFGLNSYNVLWMETRTYSADTIEIAIFTPVDGGLETYYRISWRPILPNEQRLLRGYLTTEDILRWIP